MVNFFNPFSPFFQGVRKVYQLIGISLLWFICCIPLVTAGAATTALYHTVTKVIRNSSGYLLQEYFSCFAADFKQSTGMWILFAIAGLLLSFNISVAWVSEQEWLRALLVPFGILFLFLQVTAVYFFALLARFKNSSLSLLKHAVILEVAYLPSSLLLAGGLAGLLVLAYLWTPFLFLLPACAAMLVSWKLEKIFANYIS